MKRKLIPLFLIVLLSVSIFSELYGQEAIVFGKIIDSNTGEYLERVSITITANEGILKQTTVDNTYQLSIKEGGLYGLKVEKNEYDSIFETITLNLGDSIRRDIVMRRPPKFLCIIKVNGQDCKDVLKEVDVNSSGNLFRFALFNSGSVPLKWIVNKNCEWISVFSSDNHATNGILDVDSEESKENMTVVISPEKFEAGKTTGKILVMSNNGNAVLSVKAIGKYPNITMLPPLTTAYNDSKNLFPDTFKAQIEFNGRHTYKEVGFCFSDTNKVPTIRDKCVLVNDLGELSYRDYWSSPRRFPWLSGGLGDWEEDICRTYYVRAFLNYKNENDTIIYSSNVQKFTLWEIGCPK